MPTSMQQLRSALGGHEPHFFIWQWTDASLCQKRHGHAGKLLPDGAYAAHNDRGGENGIFDDFFPRAGAKEDLWVFSVPTYPNLILWCCGPRDYWSADSSLGGEERGRFKIRHRWKCCWKEKLPGDAPWPDEPTPYACLDWDQSTGTTWDTLIGPRTNMVSCTSAVFVQSCTTSLAHGGNKVIEIRGSTDDGATWPHYVGDDHTTKVPIPWALGQRDVRIAWIYVGPVQPGHFWCVDNMGIWTKPSPAVDASVSEIQQPSGAVTFGKPLQPKVIVWNYGQQPETIQVALKIDGSLVGSTTVELEAIDDTLIRFPSMSWQPGTHTAMCYTSTSGDEVQGDDTATVTFSVVADTWIERYPVYAGSPGCGASMTTVTDNDLYCITRGTRFAKYLVSENLWKNRPPAPRQFGDGGGVAWAGGDYVYGLRGGGQRGFYRYRMSDSTWDTLARTPAGIRYGGAIAWGGGDYIYALRGYQQSFYRYCISTNSWQTVADIPYGVRKGGSLVWGGGDYLYALCGDGTPYFCRYQMSTDQWVSRTSLAVPVEEGAALTYSPVSGRIFAIPGNKTYYFYEYDTASNTWAERHHTPQAEKSGACLTFADYSVFGILGHNSDHDFWRYSPSDTILAPPCSLPPIPPPPGVPSDSGILTGEGIGFPLFSAGDSQLLAYLQTDPDSGTTELHLVYPDGSGDTIVSGLIDMEQGQLSWAPDGSQIAAAGEGGLYTVGTSDSAPVPLTLLDAGLIAHPDWSPDAASVVYSKWDGTHKLYRAAADGSGSVCLTNGAGEYQEPSYSPDGVSVVCTTLKDELYQICRIDARTGSEFQVTSDYCDNAEPSYSPDGQWIVYTKLDTTGFRQVYKATPEGTCETQLTREHADHDGPRVSPDSKWIVCTAWPSDPTSSYYGCSKIVAVDMATGKTQLDLTEANAKRTNPVWSPDGSWIAYAIKMVLSGGTDRPARGGLCRMHVRLPHAVQAEQPGTPQAYVLMPNRPNPFSGTTTIRYGLPATSRMSLCVTDAMGRVVRTLVSCTQRAGYYTVVWDGTDSRGRRVADGSYFYELEADGKVMARKMLRLK